MQPSWTLARKLSRGTHTPPPADENSEAKRTAVPSSSGVDHKALQSATLIDAKKKHHIGSLKNKQQLVKAMEKTAGKELAEKAKKEALEAGKKEEKRVI